MSEPTLDPEELRERWMKLYLNVMVLRSNHPKAQKILTAFKDKIVNMNEDFMTFFDALKEEV